MKGVVGSFFRICASSVNLKIRLLVISLAKKQKQNKTQLFIQFGISKLRENHTQDHRRKGEVGKAVVHKKSTEVNWEFEIQWLFIG